MDRCVWESALRPMFTIPIACPNVDSPGYTLLTRKDQLLAAGTRCLSTVH